ncbi:MAG: hypothetical protein D3922_08025 [Candidatus Electrothrix sp. AR1]|nr:hypothetical protein [Candidatus Electrothrix sp. AR1]
MKRAITVGLIVVVLSGGSLLIWKVQQDGWTVHGQDPAEFISGRFDSGAVEDIEPFMPPVIELVNEQQTAAESRANSNSERESVMESNTEKPFPDETGFGPEAESASIVEPEVGELSESATVMSPDNGEGEILTREREGKHYDQDTLDALFHAEKKADSHALNVLRIGREMSLKSGEIIQGGCWNYVDTVYNRAGYTGGKRRVVFRGSEETGLYADREMIVSGDWLFYINHNYRETRHSAIFIDWIDYEKQRGLMLSYGGEGRGEPARYRVYDLSHVYKIVRPVKK